MSQSLEQIESYFQGTLNAVEAREFERAIQNDPDFAKEVAFYMSVVGTMKDQLNAEKKIRFREVYDSSKMVVADQLAPSKTKGAVIRRIWKYAVAAAVFSAVLVGAYFYSSSSSPQQMAQEFIVGDLSDLGSLMSGGDSLELGKRLNGDGRYSEALAVFEEILRREPGNVKAIEFAGVEAIHLNDYDKALKYFGDLANMQGLYANPGNFYIAVTLMKRNQPGDYERAKQLLELVVKTNSTHSERAASWLKNW
ncbi:MAG: tetratricopeptide repeat protein [Chitinophagaceae bacterium]|nr:MAG: tetratricopeptide repeat protein [Chitinophagaceae bacterium]